MSVRTNDSLDVLVVGAGQTGLTVGYFLRQAGLRFLIVDGASQVGSAWAQRWESLVLFTPRRYNAMPGLAFDGDPRQGGDARRGDRLPAALRDGARPSDRVQQPGHVTRLPRRAIRRGAAGTNDPRRPGRRRHGPVPEASDPRVCRVGRSGCPPGPQHWVSTTKRPSAGPGCRGRRWQHRVSDRRGTGGRPQGGTGRRLATDAASGPAPGPADLLGG